MSGTDVRNGGRRDRNREGAARLIRAVVAVREQALADGRWPTAAEVLAHRAEPGDCPGCTWCRPGWWA